MLSRVADSLYWMSRYLERAEHTARLLAVRLDASVEQAESEATQAWGRLLVGLHGLSAPIASTDPRELTLRLSFDRLNRSSVISSMRAARDNARQVREQISTEMWERLNREVLQLNGVEFDSVWYGQPAAYFHTLIDAIHLFRGITHATMRHGEGWQFIVLGQHIERAQQVGHLLDAHFGSTATAANTDLGQPKYFDWINLLKQCTAFEAYCKVYTAAIVPSKIAEFLIFDPEFPHSIRFAVDHMQSSLDAIAQDAPQARRAACARLAGRLKATVDYGQIDEIMAAGISPFLASIQRQCETIHEAVYGAFIAYGVDEVMPA